MKAAMTSAGLVVLALGVGATSPPPEVIGAPTWDVPPRAERLHGPGDSVKLQRKQASTDWCAHLVGGPRGTREFALDLSAAHSTTRAFGVESAYGVSDTALAQALDVAGELDAGDVAGVLERYAGALGDVCALRAGTEPLGPARVHRLGPLTIIVPGTGEVQLPPGTEGVVIDLRNLAAVEELDAALAKAVGPVLQTAVERPARLARGHAGPVDEVFSATNVYSTYVSLQPQEPLAVSGSRNLPIILLTGERMPAAAAAFAGALRMAQRAWIVGADVYTEAAESHWRGVDKHGIAVRTGFFDRLTRLAPSERLVDHVVTQNDPTDPTTATYRWDLLVPEGTRLLDVTAQAPTSSGLDLDLYVLHDADGDGDFRFPDELVASSAGSTAEEHARVLGTPTPPGRYQVWVHGWEVPGGTARFDLTFDLALGAFWPDRIPADARLQDEVPASLIAQARRLFAAQPGPVIGPTARSFPAWVHPFGARQPVVTGKPETRAALLIAHGMARLFFPYFDVGGDTIDERLLETLRFAEDWNGNDRTQAENLLRRLGEALHDGHQFVFDVGPPRFSGYLPVFLEEADGRPLVRRSAVPEIHAGDTIVTMDGRAIEDLYAEQYRMTSAASPGYRFDLASRYISRLSRPVTLELAEPDGAVRRVTIAPQSVAAYLAAVGPGVSGRPSGPLDDLGAPNLYYLNMDAEASPGIVDVRLAIARAVAHSATGLVVDMRGYPAGNHYEVAARLIRQSFSSPQFWVPYRMGPGLDVEYTLRRYDLFPYGQPAWAGPIVLLTGPHAVSAAENFMQMLVGAGRLAAVVGEQPSASTNGNITGVQLPGGFMFAYTGMRVLNPDGSQHHGVGIVPDIDTAISAADLRDGVDRDLLAAIDVLSARVSVPSADPAAAAREGRQETSLRPRR